ncbi:MAG: FAD-dependent oxidoreductase [Conexibacter sp.]
MSLPVLLVIDGDLDALRDVEAQLVRRYGHDYRVESASDPEEALRALAELADAGVEVALVLAAESLSGVIGGGLLERARQLHPHAKRGLMVPWGALADPPTAEAILDSIALGRIDYYVPMPAGSPDEVFHHTISAFLLEWATERRKVPQTVHIVGREWSGRAYELRETFERCATPHAFCLADSDEGRELLAKAGPDVKLPVMILPDGRALGDPSNAEIAEAAGAPIDFDERDFDVVIVGAGPAGLSAAVYGASEGLRTLVVDEGGIGGQARSSSLIRNYLGFPRGVSGNRLAEQAYEQASVFGASFVFMHRATALSRSGEQLTLSLAEDRRVSAAAVILATGASYRRLGVPSLEALNGAGVFYGGPASEAHALSGKDVFVAGGGNSAGQAALHLARYARRVTLVVRGATLEAGMSYYLTQEVLATPSIDVRTSTTVVGGGGDGRLRELVLREAGGDDEETVAAHALFVLIGARPHTDWLPPDITRDRHGFLRTGEDLRNDRWPLERRPLALETSMPGVLAAGDVRHGSVKRVASAVGEGSVAVQLVHNLFAAAPTLSKRRPATDEAAPVARTEAPST